MAPAGERGVEAPAAKPRHLRDAIRRPRWIVTILVIAVVVVVVVLAVVPVAQRTTFGSFGSSEYGSGPIHFDDSWPQSLCPAGAKAVMTFSSTGLNVTFSITAPNGTTIWSQHSAYANASFPVPTCGTYQLIAEGVGDGTYAIDGTLSYTAPIL
jgi:hypothetical protein